MAKTKGVWGIDIGQSALKALRCHKDDEGNVVADSYDFIEYPKALSLPDADEEALVNEALETFLSRNEVRGDFVAMTVSGQSGLSRFFKPPPVDARTLPEIVKYEVRQQIPFPIEDVIWDWQSMGGTEMDNVIVDAEVGLFAIKRDTVYTALQPFLKKDIEVDVVQLAPLATQNVVCHEMMEDLPEGEVDMDSLPDSMVILAMGTDATDLIVTNGVKLWLRNIPIGGNHFTKELSRELKLTHAKAEHLKRNARQAEDPKTVFQAMRRVFNDLKKEIDRSLSYYSGMDKNASLDRIVLLGNAARLPGLRQYLTKQLEMDIAKVTSFDRLQGAVTEERSFKENLLSFAPVYGLCLQGLEESRVDTNLLPVEFVNERIVRAKKPWVLASVSLLMLGMLFSYFFANQRWWAVNGDYARDGVSWNDADRAVTAAAGRSSTLKGEDEKQAVLLDRINAISSELSEASETQAAWPELLSVLDQLLPRDPKMVKEDGTLVMVADPEKIPFVDREEIYIDHVETKYTDDVSTWLGQTNEAYEFQQGKIKEMNAKRKKRGVVIKYDIEGSGFIVEIKAHHFYNSAEKRYDSVHGLAFVQDRVLPALVSGEFQLKNAQGVLTTYKPSDIGLLQPTLISKQEDVDTEFKIPNPNFGREGVDKNDQGSDDRNSGQDDQGSDNRNSGQDDDENSDAMKKETPKDFTVPRFDFTIQMIFQPESPVVRDEIREARIKAEAELAAEEAKEAGQAAKESPARSPEPVKPKPAQPAAPAKDANDAAAEGDAAAKDDSPAEGQAGAGEDNPDDSSGQ